MAIIVYLTAAVLAVLNILGMTSVSWWIIAALALAPVVVGLVFLAVVAGGAIAFGVATTNNVRRR